MTRAQELIAPFLKDFNEAIETFEVLSEEQWRLKTANEDWPVGVVAHHLAVASGFEQIEWRLNGRSTPLVADMDEVDEINAQHARSFADCTQEETLDLLRGFSSRVKEVVDAITDEQLKMRDVAVGGGPTTVEQFILIMMPLHLESHLDSILQTISQTSAG